MDVSAIRIHGSDNVGVALRALRAGETVLGVTLIADIPSGHKFALRDLKQGEQVLKYGSPIGHATQDIPVGVWVHTQNVKSNLSGLLSYRYEQEAVQPLAPMTGTFQGYLRADGRVGVRNELWILPTVGCVNATARRLAERFSARLGARADGVYAFPHPYGCSQLGDDHLRTQRALAALTRHPNAGGVLVLGLGCENNHIAAFRDVLGAVDETRVRFLNAQDVEDEEEAGLALLEALAEATKQDVRTPQPLSKLVLGLKCGGSDGLSGVTANPLLGMLCDGVCAAGGSAILTEVPEMFGAETLLMNRCRDKATFDRAVEMINGFKAYFLRYGERVDENPSPGNKAGGITTLEDKSLGCTQKGGHGPVVDVLDYASPLSRHGLNLAYGPGNDLCAVTALACAGAQMVLFTTGRGTPFGGPVPTLKISTNTPLYEKKHGWMDFDAGVLATGAPMEDTARSLLRLVLDTASGQPALNERHDCRDICIFKDGVTL